MHDVEKLNKDTEWSIKLGFNGELNDTFYDKMESVKKVRKRILRDIIYSSVCASFATAFLFLPKHNNTFVTTLTIPVTIFFAICILSILAHVRIVFQWLKIEKENIYEYKRWRNAEERSVERRN